MKRSVLILFFTCAVLSFTLASRHPEERKLKIGITHAPPYIIDEKGIMSGVCVDLVEADQRLAENIIRI